MGNKVDVVVKKGDTLSQIANKYNTNVNKIMEINPNIKDPNLIITGSTIQVETESVDLQPKSSKNSQTNIENTKLESLLGVNTVKENYRDMSAEAQMNAKKDALNQINTSKTNKDNKNIDLDIAMALYGSGLDGNHNNIEAAKYLDKEEPIIIGNKPKEQEQKYKIPNMYKVHDNNKKVANKEINISIDADNIENKHDTKDIKTIASKTNNLNKINSHQEAVARIKNENDARFVRDRKFVAQANMEDYLQQQYYNKGYGSQSISLSDMELKKRNELLYKSGVLKEYGKVSYQGVVHSKVQATANAKNTNGIVTTNNKTWQIGNNTSVSAGTLSLNDYIYLVGQVAGESGNFSDDMLGVTTTILNRVESNIGGNNIKNVLAYGYWPFGKTYRKFVKVDKDGNLAFKEKHELSPGDYAKLELVKSVVADAMNGTRNLNKNVIYYSGNGTYNRFSDKV